MSVSGRDSWTGAGMASAAGHDFAAQEVGMVVGPRLGERIGVLPLSSHEMPALRARPA